MNIAVHLKLTVIIQELLVIHIQLHPAMIAIKMEEPINVYNYIYGLRNKGLTIIEDKLNQDKTGNNADIYIFHFLYNLIVCNTANKASSWC
jgi:hypothetical protein